MEGRVWRGEQPAGRVGLRWVMDVEVDWDVTSVRLSKWCLWWCEIFESVADRWADMMLAVLVFPVF